jgi:hypothetical protein
MLDLVNYNLNIYFILFLDKFYVIYLDLGDQFNLVFEIIQNPLASCYVYFI